MSGNKRKVFRVMLEEQAPEEPETILGGGTSSIISELVSYEHHG